MLEGQEQNLVNSFSILQRSIGINPGFKKFFTTDDSSLEFEDIEFLNDISVSFTPDIILFVNALSVSRLTNNDTLMRLEEKLKMVTDEIVSSELVYDNDPRKTFTLGIKAINYYSALRFYDTSGSKNKDRFLLSMQKSYLSKLKELELNIIGGPYNGESSTDWDIICKNMDVYNANFDFQPDDAPNTYDLLQAIAHLQDLGINTSMLKPNH